MAFATLLLKFWFFIVFLLDFLTHKIEISGSFDTRYRSSKSAEASTNLHNSILAIIGAIWVNMIFLWTLGFMNEYLLVSYVEAVWKGKKKVL